MAPMQGTRCLSLEVQIISARKDSVQTLGQFQPFFKAKRKKADCVLATTNQAQNVFIVNKL